LLSDDQQNRLLSAVRETGRLIARRTGIDVEQLLSRLRALGDELDDLHLDVHEHLWSVFRMRVSLLIVVAFLQRYRDYFETADPEGVPALAH